MQAEVTSFWGWQQRFSDEKRCLQALVKLRWLDGFVCGCYGHRKGWLLQTRHVYECAGCHHHTPITAGTAFHNTKLIGVSWITAQRMLPKLRVVMGDQNRLYRLEGIIELDDAFVGGKRPGKRGRGAEGKTAVLVACEHNNGRPGFVAMKAVDHVTQDNVKVFAQEAIAPGQTLHTNAFAALRVLAEGHHHVAKVTLPKLADEWLSWLHIVVSNFKSYVLSTYHGVLGRYMQEYLDECCYRLNRRFWENQIPNRLLKLCATHQPVFL